MASERTAIRFEREQDGRKHMTRDAGERYSRIPGWNGEADTYISPTQDVFGNQDTRKSIFAVPDLRHN